MCAVPAAKKHLLMATTMVASLVAFAVASGATGGRPDRWDKEPPSAPTNIRVVSAGETQVALTWDASTDNVAVRGYYVHANSQKARVSSPAVTVTGLDCGESVAVWIVAFDSANSRSEGASAMASTEPCPDALPPTAPSGFRQAATSRDSVVLEWDPSSDNVGTVGYSVYRDRLRVVTSAQPNATLTGLACGSTTQFSVDAVDAAGNRSERRSAWVRTADCGDANPPTTPTGLVVDRATATSIDLSWSPSTDDVGVTGYRVSVDGQHVVTSTTTTVSLAGLKCGTSYTIRVAARDAAGNSSSDATLTTATLPCAQPPTPPDQEPPSPPADTSPPTQPTNLAVGDRTATTILLSWSASIDNVSVAGYTVYLGGVANKTTLTTSATVSGLVCGTSYSLGVDAFDAAGNRSERETISASTQACSDTQAPTTPTDVTATSRTATSIALSWSPSSDNVGVTGYGLYRGGTRVASVTGATGIFSNLVCNTNYTLAVDAVDAAGNRSGQATLMVSTTPCVDSTPPSAPPNLSLSNVSQTQVTLSWGAATDNVGVTAYDVYRNDTKMGSVTSTSATQSGLECGRAYSFGVEALDAAGNRSPRSTVNATTEACSAPSAADFVGDFETGDKSQWDTEFSGRYCGSPSGAPSDRVRIVGSDGGVQPRQGTHFARYETRGDDYPCWGDTGTVTTTHRLARQDPVGTDRYLGFSLFVPTDFAFSSDPWFNIFAEWHGDNNGIAPMQLIAERSGGQLYWSIVKSYGPRAVPTSDAVRRVLRLGPMVQGRWVDFVIRTKWSKGADGLFEAWVDGEKRVSDAGENWYQSGQSGVYLAVQYYGSPGGPTRVHYKDAIRYGDSYGAVAP
jgi:chitodextrinase